VNENGSTGPSGKTCIIPLEGLKAMALYNQKLFPKPNATGTEKLNKGEEVDIAGPSTIPDEHHSGMFKLGLGLTHLQRQHGGLISHSAGGTPLRRILPKHDYIQKGTLEGDRNHESYC